VLKTIAVSIATVALCSSSAFGQAACSYDECALRLEPAWFGEALVRGHGGAKVGLVGGFGGPRLGHLAQRSDSARLYLQAYDRDYTPGAVTATLGAAAATVAWLAAAENEGIHERRNWTIIALAGTLLTWHGARRVERAHRALSRGIWWYNRDLPR
jgi:hypothetical protein